MAVVWPSKNNFVNGDVLTATNMNNIGDTLNVFNPTSATNGQVWVADGAGSGAYGTVASGLTLIKPTTINFTGTSASINTNGSVTFTAVSVLSLNGVFSATYRRYLVLVNGSLSTAGSAIPVRMRLAGTDADAANTYVTQALYSDGTTTASSRTTTTRFEIGRASTDFGCQITFYNPAVADQTIFHSLSATNFNNTADLQFAGGQHTVATAYDGFSFRQDLSANNITGTCAVYGLRD